jgi:hypothetical protein
VRPSLVVLLGEGVQQGLEAGDGGGLVGLGAQPFLHGLLEAFDLALGLGVPGAAILLVHTQSAELGLQLNLVLLDGDRSAVFEDGVVQFHRVQLLTYRDVDQHHRPEHLPRFDDLRKAVGV